jgi:hypothetical protein
MTDYYWLNKLSEGSMREKCDDPGVCNKEKCTGCKWEGWLQNSTYSTLVCEWNEQRERQEMALDPKSSYYDAGGIETIEVIKAKLTPNEYQGYLKGNLLKYLCRMSFKHDNPSRDAEKCTVYSTLLKESCNES